ncbi:ribosomal RNA processing protein 36 homolog, partial [Mantella aurantiaca]
IVQKKLRKTRNPELKDRLQQLVTKMDQQEEVAERRQKMREREMEYKREMREKARQGKRPFYLKKGEVRKAELADRFGELKRKGKLEHFLSKKRKRNSHKDRRRLPNQ